MEERKLTEKESLEVITAMIARTKQRYLGSGNMLIWGYLVVIVSIVVWLLLATTHNYEWNWVWFAIPLIGFPITTIKDCKEKRKFGVVTYSDKITSRLWTIFGISQIILILICLGFALFGEINCWGALLIYPILSAPFAEIAQGLIVKEKCLIWGGVIGLAAGLVSLCCVVGRIPLAANWYIPLFIIVWTAMMIVPGHILKIKEGKE